jgi:uncharacterized protein (UPF0332 family)
VTGQVGRLLDKGKRKLATAKRDLEAEAFEDAVSRGYYAMLHAAQAMPASRDLVFSSHSAVISAFGRHFAKTGIAPAQLHRALITAENLRLRGDYSVVYEVTREEAEEQVRRAEEFLSFAGRFLSGEDPQL